MGRQGPRSATAGLDRRIRALERLTIPYVDGIVFMSASAESFDAALRAQPRRLLRGRSCRTSRANRKCPPATESQNEPADLDLGGLESDKNHSSCCVSSRPPNRLGHRYTLDVVGDGPTGAPSNACRVELASNSRFASAAASVRTRRCSPATAPTCTRRRGEVFPYALIEAMAAGLPVVAGPVGGIAEMLDQHAEGVFWPLDDADAAARILVDLSTTNPAPALAAAARRFANSPPRGWSAGPSTTSSPRVAAPDTTVRRGPES